MTTPRRPPLRPAVDRHQGGRGRLRQDRPPLRLRPDRGPRPAAPAARASHVRRPLQDHPRARGRRATSGRLRRRRSPAAAFSDPSGRRLAAAFSDPARTRLGPGSDPARTLGRRHASFGGLQRAHGGAAPARPLAPSHASVGLTVVPVACNSLPAQELYLLDLCFLAGTPRPTLATLHEDSKHQRYLKTHEVLLLLLLLSLLLLL